MSAQILVLNGAPSAGKTSLGCPLQRQLGTGWFMLGIDDLLAAILPAGDDPELFEVDSSGVVRTAVAFRRAEAAWYAGVVAIAEKSTGLVLDEVLLDGAASQARLTRGAQDRCRGVDAGVVDDYGDVGGGGGGRCNGFGVGDVELERDDARVGVRDAVGLAAAAYTVVAPRSRSWVTNSLPRPRLAPVTRTT